MTFPHRLIVRIAESEMSRNALNNWERFRLPPENDRIDAILDKLRTSSPSTHIRRPRAWLKGQ